MGSQLTDAWRKKYPKDYDDVPDDELEKAIIAKYPEYKDIAKTPDVQPDDTTTTIPSTTTTTIPDFKSGVSATEDAPAEGWLSKGYHALTDPLTDAPTRFGHSISQYLTNPVEGESPTRAMVKGAIGGATEGVGNVLSGFTSPLNLATLGMGAVEGTAAKMGMETLPQIMNIGQKIAAAPMAAHGAYDTLRPDASLQERGMGLAEIAGAGAAAFHSPAEPHVAGRMPEAIRPEILDQMNEAVLPHDMVPVGGEAQYNGQFRAEKPLPVEEMSFNLARDKFNMGQEPGSAAMMPTEQAGKVLTGDVVNEGAPPIREKTGNFWIDDANRMEDEALSRRSDPAQAAEAKAKNDEWNNRTKAINEYEGRFNEPNTKPIPDAELTPQQLAVRQSYQAIEHLKQEHSRWFSEQEEQLPEGEYYKEPPEHKAAHDAELQKLEDRHDEILQDYKDSIKAPDGVVGGEEPQSVAADMGEKPQGVLGNNVNVILKAEKATPETIKKALEAGYELIGHNDNGDFRFRKLPEGQPVPEQPILEGELPQGKRLPLGPEIDAPKEGRNLWGKTQDFSRSMMATMDMSAPLRQGIGLAHKAGFWKAILPMIKSFGSEKVFQATMDSIAERPLFKSSVDNAGNYIPSFAEKSGLKLTDLGDMSKREEAFMSQLAEKWIPGVRNSERAYTVFLNKLRSDTFESLVKSGKVLGADGEANVPLAKAMADFVNTATGRGSLGKLEPAANILNQFFFAPRLIASRLSLMDPRKYLTGDPMMRKEYLKSLLTIVGAGNAIGQVAKMAGADVDSNPTSSDYGKIRIGKVRLDPFAGFQQYAVLASRIKPDFLHVGNPTNTGIVPVDNATGFLGTPGDQTTSSTTGKTYTLGAKFGRQTRFDVAERFVESKLAPIISLATAFMHGKDLAGNKFNLPEEVATRFVPLFVQDMKNLLTEDPNITSGYNKELHPENLPLAIPGFFGMGTQLYGDRTKSIR